MLVFAVGTLVGIKVLLAPLDYLPKGNRNLIFGLMTPPPGYNIDQLHTIGQRIESVTPIDMSTGEVGNPVSLGGGVSWVVTGLNDGYLVHPTDEDAYGLYAYWSPEAGLTEIPGLPQRSRFLAAGGRTALFASPGPMIIALDITTGTRRDIDVGGRGAADIGHACISPDGRHAILSDSTGTATIIDVNAQSITATLQAAVDGRSLGWTSNTQAILLNTDRSRVLAFNLPTREATAIAEVNPDTNYWIGGSASQC